MCFHWLLDYHPEWVWSWCSSEAYRAALPSHPSPRQSTNVSMAHRPRRLAGTSLTDCLTWLWCPWTRDWTQLRLWRREWTGRSLSPSSLACCGWGLLPASLRSRPCRGPSSHSTTWQCTPVCPCEHPSQSLPPPITAPPTLSCPSHCSVQESIALMQICQHSKFVHVPESMTPCFVPVMQSCQGMMQSSPPEPLPLVYSLAPSTVAYFPPPPIAQQTDDRGYASAESSPVVQVSSRMAVM